MRYTIIAVFALFAVTACGKHKKYCWRCEFATSATGSGQSDTTVCNMTEEESKNFQQNHVRTLKELYGFPAGTNVTSSCRKIPQVR